MELLYALLASLFAVVLAQRLIGQRRKSPPLPPGPKGLPFLGLLFHRPDKKIPRTYRQWTEVYGELVYYHVIGQPIIIVNSERVAFELFEKRSTNYSDRPAFRMYFNLMEQSWNFAFLRYNDAWRNHRRMFHQSFNAGQVGKYYDIQVAASAQLVKSMLTTPDAFFTHVRHHSGSIVLRITYGYQSQPTNDPYITKVDDLLRKTVHAASPGRYLVDYFPILEKVPAWAPFAAYAKEAQSVRPLTCAVRDDPYNRVQRSMANGTALPSFVTDNIERIKDEKDIETVKNVAAMIFGAGADTTVAAVLTSILAMVLNPAIQAKAHSELDAVVGRQRLPNFGDKNELPLISAIVLEAVRWRPVLPANVAHAAVSDDIFEGYSIPAGSAIIVNNLSILHDPNTYRDPETFNPSRFLGDAPDPDPTIRGVFGFGRRICPGRYLALNTAFIAVASLLWAFHLDGNADDSDDAFADQGLWHPLPFKCKITPRFPEVNGVAEAAGVD